MTLQEFTQFFQGEEDCKEYLFNLKWKGGFKCRRCHHSHFWKGRTKFHARCTRCDYDESITAHTVFHKIQIPLMKSFLMVFFITVLKKGISSVDLAKIFNIDEKTALRFRGRVQDAMGSWLSKACDRQTNVKFTKLDGIIVANRGEELNGLQRLDLKLEEYKRNTPRAKITRFRSIVPIKNGLDQCGLVGGRYIDENKDIRVWNYRTWLTGIHHHCSQENLPKYENEFLFRFNNRGCQKAIWHILINEMMLVKPHYSRGKVA